MKPIKTVRIKRITAKPLRLSPEQEAKAKADRIERRLKAAHGLLGMWAEKDTSFFDKR